MGGRNAVNEATERLARTGVGSYKALMDNTMVLQVRNVRFALGIIDGSLEELRRQVESNRTITRELIRRTEEQRNAFQTLVGGSANAYVSLFFAPFHYFREGSRFVMPKDVESGGNGSLPIENYDKLTLGEVSDKIGGPLRTGGPGPPLLREAAQEPRGAAGAVGSLFGLIPVLPEIPSWFVLSGRGGGGG